MTCAIGRPTHEGRIVDEPSVPVSRLMGPGSPIPTPITCWRSAPASASTSSTRTTAASMASSAGRSMSTSVVRSASAVCARSNAATRRRRCPKSTAMATPAARSSASRTPGRPPRSPPGSVPSRSTTSPISWRSPTMLDTVERERPVTRASSARLARPRSLSALMTLRRFSSRNDPSDPDVLLSIASHPLRPAGRLSRVRRNSH